MQCTPLGQLDSMSIVMLLSASAVACLHTVCIIIVVAYFKHSPLVLTCLTVGSHLSKHIETGGYLDN